MKKNCIVLIIFAPKYLQTFNCILCELFQEPFKVTVIGKWKFRKLGQGRKDRLRQHHGWGKTSKIRGELTISVNGRKGTSFYGMLKDVERLITK